MIFKTFPKENKILNLILIGFICAGITFSLINFFSFRSLWLDEASLALNIVNRSAQELLTPLENHQVAPIGFLMVERFFSVLFEHTDWSLRIFPMLSFFISIPLLYRVSQKIIKVKTFSLFATASYALSSLTLYYSSEVKQYMPDVFITLSILLLTLSIAEKKQIKTSSLIWFALLGVISVWFSNISVIILFSSGLYLSHYFISVKRKEALYQLIVVITFWVTSFFIYYSLFIYGHPEKKFMLNWWSKFGGFIDGNLFSPKFFNSLFGKALIFFKMSHSSSYLVVLFLPFSIIGGIFLLSKKERYLLLLPIIIHLLLAYFRLHPFETRLILYLQPLLLILITYGIFKVFDFLHVNHFFLNYFLTE